MRWDSSPNLTQQVTKILNYSGLIEYSIGFDWLGEPSLTWQTFSDPLMPLTALIGHKSLERTIEVLLSQFVKVQNLLKTRIESFENGLYVDHSNWSI